MTVKTTGTTMSKYIVQSTNSNGEWIERSHHRSEQAAVREASTMNVVDLCGQQRRRVIGPDGEELLSLEVSNPACSATSTGVI